MTKPVLETDRNTDVNLVSMDHPQKVRLRDAAVRATCLYPGPVGEMLAHELLTWEEFGYRLGGHRLIMRLVDHLLTTPFTQTEVA